MARKMLPMQERKTALILFMVPPRVREQVDELAHRERTSVSEIGRRAIAEFIEKQRA
jgi:predicted transcriptional regulator